MSLQQSLSRFFASASSVYRGFPQPVVPPVLPDPNTAVTTYHVMRALYDVNGLYEELMATLRTQGIWSEARMPLRDPANRVAEFYAVKLWPGADLDEALPLVFPAEGQGSDGNTASVDTEVLKQAIQLVWTWSNWAAQKQVAARWLAIYGDLFIKVVGRGPREGIENDPPRVYFQLLEPETVTALDSDERGFLTYLRLDVPKIRRVGDKEESYTHTEVWDKATGLMREWDHTKGERAALDQLGAPLATKTMAATGEAGFGIDFIPVVHAKFRDVGDQRGVSAYMHAFDKIMEADRSCTRLNQMVFRHAKSDLVLSANDRDATGRPMPPPTMGETDTVTLGDETIYKLPGMSTLESLVAQLPYSDMLAILQDHMQELERDLPELAYYRLRDMGSDISGRAVRMLLSDAVDRVLEARGNAEAALVRADQMAITIGQVMGAFPGLTLGTFEEGALDHSFAPRDVIPTDGLEDAQGEQAEVLAKISKLELGASKQEMLGELGYDEAKVTEMLAQAQAEREAGAEQFLQSFAAGRVPMESANGNGRSN